MSPHQRVLTAAALTVKSRRIRSARAVAAGSGDLGPLPRARCAAVAVGVRVARLGGRGGWHRRWGPPMLTGLANSISLLANVMSLGERRRPSMPRAGLTSQRVVQEAGVVADASGLDRLTLAAVADRFGVAIPSLYKHVNGLDGLRRDLAVLAVRELTTALSRAAVGRAGRDALHAMADAYRAYATAHPGPYAASVRAPAPGDPAA